MLVISFDENLIPIQCQMDCARCLDEDRNEPEQCDFLDGHEAGCLCSEHQFEELTKPRALSYEEAWTDIQKAAYTGMSLKQIAELRDESKSS